MTDIEPNDFTGYSHNSYQESMHKLANLSLYLIVIIGVAVGAYGVVVGLN